MGRKKKEEKNVNVNQDFPQKYLKVLGDFPEKADSMSTDDLKRELCSCEQTIFYNEQDMSKDPDLKQAQDKVKMLKEPFEEVIKENQAKVKYIAWTLQSRGQTPSPTDAADSEDDSE